MTYVPSSYTGGLMYLRITPPLGSTRVNLTSLLSVHWVATSRTPVRALGGYQPQ